MTIIEYLKNRTSKENNKENSKEEFNLCTKLYNLAEEIANKASIHLKLIISQLPEFDIHDVSHSEKVLKNMEDLMTDKIISKLTSYELFLLYLSAYLHDCAMALPEWELKLLKLTEGTEEFLDDRIKKPLMHDFKPPFKLSEAMKIINDRKTELYGCFGDILEFIFVSLDENEFMRDLGERLIEYQEFRNGYIDELKKICATKDKARYLEYSELLRYEFIRSTHANRIEKYVKNLAPLFSRSLEGT